MGRNRDLRRKIAGRQRAIEEHKEKMQAEWAKPHPDVGLIEHWESEIESIEREIARLLRRLKRNW